MEAQLGPLCLSPSMLRLEIILTFSALCSAKVRLEMTVSRVHPHRLNDRSLKPHT